MTAQTAAAQEVVGKVEGGGYRVVDRNFRERSKGTLGAKSGPDSVYLIPGGEMQRSDSLGHLPGVACAAGFLHPVRMGGLADEPGMGLLLRCALRISSVAVGAGETVAGVEPDLRVTALAAGRTGRNFQNGWLFRSLALPAPGKGQGKQAGKQ